jgi:hypothetical protein
MPAGPLPHPKVSKMVAYSQLELNYARPLADGLINNEIFRKWFLAGTRYAYDYSFARPIGKTQSSLRSPKMKNPYWFNYWCGKDSGCPCRIGTGIETDILLVLERDNGRRLALHIEIKRPGKGLEDGQAESYPRRAECWLNPNTRPRTVPPHQDFLTIIVCGRDLGSDSRLGFFDKVVFHDEVANQLEANHLMQGRPITE